MSAEIAHALPEVAGLESAQALLRALRDAGPEASLRLEAATVRAMSTPFVLTLAAALRDAEGGPARIVVADPTPAFMDAFSDLGLFGDLMKMEFAT